jgi:hypothetical protein
VRPTAKTDLVPRRSRRFFICFPNVELFEAFMMDSRDGHYVICPLCEGKGKMHREELVDKLANHDVEAKLTACRQQLAQANAGEQRETPETKTFHEEVLKGPVTRILWRRSSKE